MGALAFKPVVWLGPEYEAAHGKELAGNDTFRVRRVLEDNVMEFRTSCVTFAFRLCCKNALDAMSKEQKMAMKKSLPGSDDKVAFSFADTITSQKFAAADSTFTPPSFSGSQFNLPAPLPVPAGSATTSGNIFGNTPIPVAAVAPSVVPETPIPDDNVPELVDTLSSETESSDIESPNAAPEDTTIESCLALMKY